MKSNLFVRQILIAALIIALFTIGLFVFLHLTENTSVSVLSLHDFSGATAAIYSHNGDSTGADCPLYSLKNGTYLALFDASCSLFDNGLRSGTKIVRSGNQCEILNRGKKDMRPILKAQSDGRKYEFFGGEISFYPLDDGWVSVICLLNGSGNAMYECVRFGNLEMTARQYRNAYPEEESDLWWDEENEVYVDEMGEIHKIRYGFAFETPVLHWIKEKDAYVSFYLTDSDYACLMENQVFALLDTNSGSMNALFQEKDL